MSTKKTKITYQGINRDLAKSRTQNNLYYDANNIKLTPVEDQSFGTVSNADGNKFEVSFPVPQITKSQKLITYGDKELTYTNQEIDNMKPVGGAQKILGHAETTKGAIIFTTDSAGVDCIWEIDDLDKEDFELELLYIRNMELTINNPIQALFNYENELIQKIYWVDGKNFLRFINIKQSIANGFDQELIDLPVSSINSRSTVDISKPTVEDGRGGGVHTAGVIQYGYTLYNLNGAETALSPLSDLFPLDKGDGEGGGDVNETVGAMPIVIIEDIDVKYTFIKVFSVKYTEYNGVPSITLIYDGNIGNYNRFTLNDTGTKNLGTLGSAEFLFLGADPIKPKHIASKDNILFAANNTSVAYKLDIDTRAYSFNKAGSSAEIYSNVVYNGIGDIPYTGDKIDVDVTGYEVDEDFDCINLDFDEFRYLDSGTTGTPGAPVLDAATFNGIIQHADTVTISGPTSSNTSKSISVTCDQNNVNPTYYDIELNPGIGQDNKIQATVNGEFYCSFQADESTTTISGVSGTAKVSSFRGFIQVFSNINSNVVIREELMDSDKFLFFDTIFGGSVSLNAGEAYKCILRLGVHYSNDSCPYQSYDSASTGGYGGDGPYVGPDETGFTTTATLDVEYEGYNTYLAERAERNVLLPLVATAGETNITDGKYVSSYVGTVDTTVNITVNQGGLQQQNTDLYSLGLFRNGTLIDSQSLKLVNSGIIQRVFYFKNVAVNFQDIIDVRMVNTKFVADGKSGPLVTDDLNLSISGDFTMVQAVSSGSNGEGGTGKYLSYELTRTHKDNLGLPLKQAKFFKDNEIYRIGVVFFNSIGQASEAKWIADFKAPEGNLEGQYNTLKVVFNAAFYEYINTLDENDIPTNYTIVRALRYPTDKTIISQGMLTGMFVQDYTADKDTTDTYEKRAAKNSELIKLPIPMTRGYGNGKEVQNSYFPVFPTKHNITMNQSKLEDSSRGDSRGFDQRPNGVIIDEIYSDDSKDHRRQQSWQYTKLFQMHSPETAFRMQVVTTDKDKLHILGYMKRNTWKAWEYNVKTDTFGPHLSNKEKQSELGENANFYPYAIGGYGVIGPSFRSWESGESRDEYTAAGYTDTRKPANFARRMHINKTFLPLIRPNQELEYEIYNRPEVTEVGQSVINYNNDTAMQYANKLTFAVSDVKQQENAGEIGGGGTEAPQINSILSEGNRCLTMALGDSDLESEDRKGLDDVYYDIGTGEWDVELFGEIRKEKSYIYSGAIYGGYDVSSRSRTEYVSIGDVVDAEQPTIIINSPGDTFVQTFKNTRLTRSAGSTYAQENMCIVETLEYLVESTVNLEERNDTSLRGWDYSVDPSSEEGVKYNTVYSTDSTLKSYTSDNLKIREVTKAETEIIASKTKIPGEFVDNWADFLPNEVQYLDGKHGPINSLVSHFDQLYGFQDFAVAAIAVNPRVQTQGADGITIELGTGQVLHDYHYISTKIGSINKWGIVSTNSGLYFLDANNKQLQKLQPTKGIETISDAKGLHAFLHNNLDRDELRVDNPGTGKGVVLGYDSVNGDIFTSVLGTKEFTLSYNEKLGTFTSFYDFIPTRFITKGDRIFTVPKSYNSSIYGHNGGNYQEYYGEKFDSNITMLVNTEEPNADKVFNSIEFESETYLDGEDQSESTIDSIEAWTSYQHSEVLPLALNKNLKRRFRTWKALIPREASSRARLRDKWLYLKVGFKPDTNQKLILHDIIVKHT